MASISRELNGRRTIQFVGGDGKRRSIRLGKVSKRLAETVQVKVEHLNAAQSTGGALDGETARWVADLDETLHARLAAVGLLEHRKAATIDSLLDAFPEANPHAKPATLVVWGQVARCLREHFGDDRQLRTIGRAEAEGFRQWLVGKKLAATTITKRVQFARQFFTHAVRCEWIERNPFADVSHKGGDPRARQHYVTEEETALLINAAPNWVWRTIIALARYGGRLQKRYPCG